MGTPVRVISPDGKAGTLDSDELEAATQQGFRLETDQDRAQAEFGGTAGETLASLAGAGRGITLGLSDAIATKTFGVAPRALKGYETANPKASIGGELVGAVLPAFIPGVGEATGPGLVSKLGAGVESAATRALGDGVVAKLGAKALAGAAEGAIYGAGSAVGESARDDVELTGEKLLAGMGLGALFGGAGNAVVGGVGMGVTRAGQAAQKALADIAPEGVQASLQKFARERALKAAGFIQSDLSKLEPERQMQLAQDLLDAGAIKPGAKVDEIWEAVKGLRKEQGERIGAMLKAADEAAPQGFDLKAFVAKAREDVLPAFDDPALRSQHRALTEILDDYAAMAEKSEGVTFKQANGFKTKLQQSISKFTDTPAAQQGRLKLQGVLDDEIERQMSTALGEKGLGEFKDAKRLFGSFAEATKAGKKGVNRALGNRAVSLTDYLTGIGGAAAGVATGNVAPLLLSGAATVGNKIARERGSSFLASYADQLASSGRFQSVLEDVTKKLQTGITEALEDGGRLAQSGRRGATQAVVGDLLESALGPLSVDKKPKDRHDAIASRIDQLAQLRTNPEAVTDRVAQALSGLDAPPDVQGALATSATRALDFLAQVAPKPANPPTVAAMARPWRPSDFEVSRFERHLRAVSDPLAVLEDMRHGKVTREAIEALQAVYPKLAEELRTEMTVRLADKKSPLTYSKRQAVAALLGQDADANKLALLQGVHQAAAQDQAEQQQRQGARFNQAGSFATDSQRLAGRRGP